MTNHTFKFCFNLASFCIQLKTYALFVSYDSVIQINIQLLLLFRVIKGQTGGQDGLF